jgi:hypothetical protein
MELNPYEIVPTDFFNEMLGQKYHVPHSEHLIAVLPPRFSSVFSNTESFVNAFEEFEYFYCIAYCAEYYRINQRCWAPVGRFSYRKDHRDYLAVPARLASEIGEKEYRELLSSKDDEEFQAIMTGFDEFVKAVARHFY